jgi:hypothetical protein
MKPIILPCKAKVTHSSNKDLIGKVVTVLRQTTGWFDVKIDGYPPPNFHPDVPWIAPADALDFDFESKLTRLADHSKAQLTWATTFNVDYDAVLDEIMRHYDFYSRADSVIILDCSQLNVFEPKLAKILGLPEDVEFPVDGYIVFYK